MAAPTWARARARARMGTVEMAAPTWARARAWVHGLDRIQRVCMRAHVQVGAALSIEWRAF